jgi:hypothetical protein
MPPVNYLVDWTRGSIASIEVLGPDARKPSGVLRFKYTPLLKSTLRSPLIDLDSTLSDFGPIEGALDALTNGVRTRRAAAAAAAVTPAAPFQEAAREVGFSLMTMALPLAVRRALASGQGFLEIVVDEALLEYPWELMSDGESFLCLRHWMGRFVNASTPDAVPASGATDWNALAPGPLQVLLISVADPPDRGGKRYGRLLEAEAETQAIVGALTGAGVALTILQGPQATWTEVQKAFRAGYHIIHFNGHAEFNAEHPRQSGLVLHDQNMRPGQIAPFLQAKPPVLFFVNACETAATGGGSGRGQQAFGLARAFLRTGAYLLGTRWRVEDAKAARFAESFYTSLLAEKSIGESVRDARAACKDDADPGDFSWASYVYYGDPRVGFRKLPG